MLESMGFERVVPLDEGFAALASANPSTRRALDVGRAVFTLTRRVTATGRIAVARTVRVATNVIALDADVDARARVCGGDSRAVGP